VLSFVATTHLIIFYRDVYLVSFDVVSRSSSSIWWISLAIFQRTCEHNHGCDHGSGGSWCWQCQVGCREELRCRKWSHQHHKGCCQQSSSTNAEEKAEEWVNDLCRCFAWFVIRINFNGHGPQRSVNGFGLEVIMFTFCLSTMHWRLV